MNELFLSNESISIAVRDFLYLSFLSVKLVLTNIKLLTICHMYKWTVSDVSHEILHQIILYYQQGNKSLN